MPRSWLALALAAPLLGGCLQVCYLGQAVLGQDDIGFRARPLDEAIADPRVSARTRAMLSMIEDVKRFGERRGLTRTESYREFADLERDAVVWVVTASNPLRFEPLTWRFPIVGEVPYLGWFDRADAVRHARELHAAGHDVYVREARAYSTLGWFHDPVLSTMLRDGPDEVANVVLHESMHATHFVPSQTVFNESLANFVANRLTAEYLVDGQHADAWRLHEYRDREAEHERRVGRLQAAHASLTQLYASNLPEDVKRAKKRETFEALERELGVKRELNNAALLQVQAYNSGQTGFSALFASCGGEWSRFLAAVRAIGPADFREADEHAIDPLLVARAKKGCGGS